jgi:hypothetical protein
MAASEIQKVCVKVSLDAPGRLNPDPVLEIFARWRTEEGEELVDLADYAHLAEGPLVVLIGHRYNLAIDTSGGRAGIQYCSKKGLSGSPAGRFSAVIKAGLAKARRLVAEPGFPPGVRPRPEQIEVVLNDRLSLPNDDEADREIRPALTQALDLLYGNANYTLTRDPDSSRRLCYRAEAPAQNLTLDSLLARLG